MLNKVLGVALLMSPAAVVGGPMFRDMFGPVVHIVAVDRIAYEDASLPEWGIETPATPSRKAAFLVRRTGSIRRPLTVNYKAGGTASNGVDYTALSGQVTIPAGSRFARIIVHPIDDAEVERRTVGSNTVANETVVLTLQPSPAYGLNRLLHKAKAVIVDDDQFTPGGVVSQTPNFPPFSPLPPPLPGGGGSIQIGITIIPAQRPL